MSARLAILSLACCAGLALSASAAVAAGVAVPVRQGTIYTAQVKAPIASEGSAYVQMYFKTNAHGRVARVVDEGVEKIPLICTAGGNTLLGNDGIFEGEDVIAPISASGRFSYSKGIPESNVEYLISGRILPGGRRATGTLKIAPSREILLGPHEGCSVTPTAMKWSVDLHWRKFG